MNRRDVTEAMRYAINDAINTHAVYDKWVEQPKLAKVSPIKRVIFNNPATIVYWKDGIKTVVKCDPEDVFDPEKGLLLAIAKRYFGNTGHYNDVLREHAPLCYQHAGPDDMYAYHCNINSDEALQRIKRMLNSIYGRQGEKND